MARGPDSSQIANHDEAVRSFRAAADADPGFAMAYWGIAWALGPNINAPMTDPEVAREAYAMAQEAKARSGRAPPVERALIAQHAPVLKISVDLIVGSPAERAALIAAAAVDSTGTRNTFAGTIDLDDTLNTGLHAVQREHILRVLNATRWVIEGNSGAALRLGMKPATLRHRMKKLGISRALNPQTG